MPCTGLGVLGWKKYFTGGTELKKVENQCSSAPLENITTQPPKFWKLIILILATTTTKSLAPHLTDIEPEASLRKTRSCRRKEKRFSQFSCWSGEQVPVNVLENQVLEHLDAIAPNISSDNFLSGKRRASCFSLETHREMTWPRTGWDTLAH